MNLSKQLKAWRQRKKLTQVEAAEQLGTNLRTYQDWEQGRRTPRGIGLQAVLERIK